MKERPIIFSGPMVKALRDGRKTQTRRIVKLPIPDWANHVRNLSGPPWNIFQWVQVDKTHHPEGICVNWWPEVNEGRSCPYGKPGDRLWVKETWKYADWTEDGDPWISYAAGGEDLLCRTFDEEWNMRLGDIWEALSHPDNYSIDNRAADRRWRPSIFMPRWASRILLELTGVRVERLQDISDEDSLDEGVYPTATGLYPGSPRAEYRKLWESIYGASWTANPYVWVLELLRIEP